MVQCENCGRHFDKPQKRVSQTLKEGRKHACSRKCSSAMTNEQRRSEPSTRQAEYVRRDKEKNPDKNVARTIVRKAIESGKIKPPQECELCFEETGLDAHHPDHNEPLLLVFLCPSCHKKADASSDKYISLATNYSPQENKTS